MSSSREGVSQVPPLEEGKFYCPDNQEKMENEVCLLECINRVDAALNPLDNSVNTR